METEGKKKVILVRRDWLITVAGTFFFALFGCCISVPSGIPHVRIGLDYAVLAFCAVLGGPKVGFLIALVGQSIVGLVTSPSFFSFDWPALCGTVFIGWYLGMRKSAIPLSEGRFGLPEMLDFFVDTVLANAIAWVVITAPIGYFLLHIPAREAWGRSVVLFVVDTVSAVLFGSIMSFAYASSWKKKHPSERIVH